MTRRPRARLAAALVALGVLAGAAPSAATETRNDVPVRVAMVDGVAESGLAQWLVDDFHALHPEIPVAVLSGSDREVLEMARQSEVDLVVAHHRPSEDAFVADGWARSRTRLMYGQYMLYGPPGDPLRLRSEADVLAALRRIAAGGAPVRAAAMDTGAGLRLAELWAVAGIAPGQGAYAVVPGGPGKALVAAADANGYTIAETTVFLPLRRELAGRLDALARPVRALRDTYSLMTVSAERAPGVREALADTFRDYLLSARGQNRIGSFLMSGATTNPFFPAAGDDARLLAERGAAEFRWVSLMLFVSIAALIASLVGVAVFGVRWRDARRSNRRHRRVEERFALAFESTGDGLWDWDREEGEAYLSRRFREIARLGTRSHRFPAPDELWPEILHPDDRERVRRAVEAALSDDGDGRVDVRARLDPARGEPLQVAIRGIAHRNREGTRTRIVGTLSLARGEGEVPAPS